MRLKSRKGYVSSAGTRAARRNGLRDSWLSEAAGAHNKTKSRSSARSPGEGGEGLTGMRFTPILRLRPKGRPKGQGAAAVVPRPAFIRLITLTY